jgi:hypothetical protein
MLYPLIPNFEIIRTPCAERVLPCAERDSIDCVNRFRGCTGAAWWFFLSSDWSNFTVDLTCWSFMKCVCLELWIDISGCFAKRSSITKLLCCSRIVAFEKPDLLTTCLVTYYNIWVLELLAICVKLSAIWLTLIIF